MTTLQSTEELLDKLLKKELIPIVLSLDEHNKTLQNRMSEMNNKVVEEMRKFNENFSKFQSDFSITKCVNTELTKQMLSSERKCWVNAQHSKKEYVEVVGIYHQVDDKHLETKVLSIFQKFNCPVHLNSWLTVIDLVIILTE